jgi:hypothetical protein
MENARYFDIRLFDDNGQLALVVPVASEKYETALMQAERVMSEHDAAKFEIRGLP